MAHHLLKLELAAAARAAGAHCEMEVRGPDGVWRADVMASDPGGAWRVALEAQLSPITPDAIAARAERMRVNDVPSVWFSDRLRPPWLGLVPSVRLVTDEDGSLVVAEGLARFAEGFWEAGPQVPLAEFLGWVFADRAVPHRRIVQRTRYPLEPLFTVWTAPQYVRAEAAYREERDHREQGRWEAEWHQAAIHALRQRQAALQRPVVEFVYQEAGAYPKVAKAGTPEFAMGLPVYIRGEPYAVICPVASRIPALRNRLAPLVLFVASEGERQRIATQARPGQRIEALDGHQPTPPPVPQQEQPDPFRPVVE
ncbi:competence protein CoiA family protein [Streptomyces sp. DSM 40750]|uniref:competence protein CoiA family protein n=1 Tax=Streptomyces sp. DSM 40750 TaxID=2801030 RepID=UPI00214D0371|nr:RNA methyltransferase [Streptomyces sp. DSM 40750]UUU21205.1 RNA methyltransferase [Streptomyces sp. DSM 40750]